MERCICLFHSKAVQSIVSQEKVVHRIFIQSSKVNKQRSQKGTFEIKQKWYYSGSVEYSLCIRKLDSPFGNGTQISITVKLVYNELGYNEHMVITKIRL